MQRYKDKVAIVTGAASGLGAAIAAGLQAEGATVVATDIAFVGDAAGETLRLHHDVASEASWRAVLAVVRERCGRLDVVVNSAGILIAADIEHAGSEDFTRTMAVNALGTMLGCRLAIAEMRAYDRPGAIVNVASTTALRSDVWTIAYAASKAAVVSMTRTIALHCARSGYPIRVNAVLPGVVLTPMVRKLIASAPDPQAAKAELEALHPIGRLLRPEEIVPAVLLLGADEASGMTGSCVVVDGGLTIA